jgi:hypothetical protein
MIFAFTIMEAVVAVIILAILVGLGVEGYKAYQKSRKITVGRWTTAPTSIPPSPGIGANLIKFPTDTGDTGIAVIGCAL